ncbi:MAG: GNAT family N-acetyltransferase [Sphingopyxis sp.]
MMIAPTIETPTIETGRLRLRAAELRDFDAFAAMWADEAVVRHIGGQVRNRYESWMRFIGLPGMWPLMGYGYWIFADRTSDHFVGTGGLSWFERGLGMLEGAPEAGWAFVADAWGRGYASEAMGAALNWADSVLGAAEVRCIINPGHAASERVAVKLGFAHVGSEMLHDEPINVYARARG